MNTTKETQTHRKTSSHQWREERLEGQDKMGMGLRDINLYVLNQ